jgi:NAD(P)-dependent dehydrogenase (short-subunit alcohol dehydrogenase family)
VSRIAIVTGAGTGIGRAVTLALVKGGFAVALAGRRADCLEETAALADAPGETLVHPADVTQPEAVKGLFEAVRVRFGRLDLLFNNAGAGAPSVPLEELDLADWCRVVDVNLTAAFMATQQAFLQFKSQTPMGGRIINNGSISAQSPRPRSAAYTATKHAITGLTKSTALDGRPFNIACGQIDIGNAATEMTRRMAAGAPQADGSLRPEPTIDVSAVADAVAYMAGLPLEANVQFMTVMATGMPYIGRG